MAAPIASCWQAPPCVIIDPTGTILAGPARHEEIILYAEVDLAAVRAARRYFDPGGPIQPSRYLPAQRGHRSRAPVVESDPGTPADQAIRQGPEARPRPGPTGSAALAAELDT